MDVHADVIALRDPGEPGALGKPYRKEEHEHFRHGMKDEIGGNKVQDVVRQHVAELRVALASEHVAERHNLKVYRKEQRRQEWK